MSDPHEISIPFVNLELHLEQSSEPVDEQAEIERLSQLAKKIQEQ